MPENSYMKITHLRWMWHKNLNIFFEPRRTTYISVCGKHPNAWSICFFCLFSGCIYIRGPTRVARSANHQLFGGVAAAAVITIAWEIIGAFSQHPEHDPRERPANLFSLGVTRLWICMHFLLTDSCTYAYTRIRRNWQRRGVGQK